MLYNLDGRPVSAADIGRLTCAVTHRGPDGIGHWVKGAVGLGHCLLATTPEALHERQPLRDPLTGSVLTFDGRLDNRTELKDALERRGTEPVDDGDAALVLAAYRQWGLAAPARLLGDFALAVWDPSRQHVFCARDPLGKRAFCYLHDRRRFVAGTELRQVLADPEVDRTPNEGMVAEYLASAITNSEETLYAGVRRLPAGHMLLVDARKLQVTRWWSPDPSYEIRYPSDADYASALLELLREAVACRSRVVGRLGIELSGGLDSTTIASIATDLRKSGVSAPESIETFSLVFPGLCCDETPFIELAVGALRVVAHRISGAHESGTPETTGQLDFPFYPNGTMANGLKAHAATRGCRVLLTGFGGDDWLSGSPYRVADDLRRLRLARPIRQLLAELTQSQEPDRLSLVAAYRLGILPLMGSRIRQMVRRIIPPPDRRPSWLPHRFASRVALEERIALSALPLFRSHAQQDIYASATSGVAIHGTEMEERLTAAFGLEQRHPLDDLRIVTFALAIPEDQRWHSGETRVVLRRAMQGRLPEAIRRRQSKPDFSVLVARALASAGAEAFDSTVVEALGWIDGPRVREMHHRMLQMYADGDECYSDLAWPLWMVYAIDRWYRTAFA